MWRERFRASESEPPALAVVVLAGLALAGCAHPDREAEAIGGAPSRSARNDVKDLPIACALPPDDLAARREALLPHLGRLATSSAEIPGGRRLSFEASSETLETIARTVDAERRCCPFLRFTLAVEPDGGPFVLDVTGPEGTKEFLRDLLAPPTPVVDR